MPKFDIWIATLMAILFITAFLGLAFDSFINSEVTIECLKQNPNNAIVCKDIR